MPELAFEVTGVDAAVRGLVPLLHFKLAITNQPPNEQVQSVILQAQIQIQAPQRAYSPDEKEKLFELFGEPDQWGQTLRNKLWAHTNTTVPAFQGSAEATLSVPCSYDLNLAGTKYFFAIEQDDIPLLFLFSGTIFYAGADGRLQVQRISWEKECVYHMPVQVWKDVMERHYPNTGWLYLQRDVFERLCQFKRRSGVTSWEQVIEQLLAKVANGNENDTT